jgi:hypothetical protein
MRIFGKTALLICIVCPTYLSAEKISMASNPFTFPEITRVSVAQQQKPVTFFRHSGLNPFSQSVTFNWSLPNAADKSMGTIVVYSLLGRVIKTLPVSGNTGTATWNFTTSQSRSGLYIVRIRYGNQIRNLKLMMWN